MTRHYMSVQGVSTCRTDKASRLTTFVYQMAVPSPGHPGAADEA